MTMVTIVIPTFHRPQQIEKAVVSALAQTCSPSEIIVVDDNGQGTSESLKTQEVLKSYIETGKIMYFGNVQNSGGSFSRNVGLQHATGKYVTFLDDDDEIAPTKLDSQIAELEKLGCSWSACYTDFHEIRPNGEIWHSAETAEGDVYRYALSRSIFIGSGSNFVVRTENAKRIGGYDISFKRNQDLEFLTRILKGYRLAHIKEDLMTIHHEEWVQPKSYAFLVNLDQFYMDKFQPDIAALKPAEQKRVYDTIALERFRYSRSGHLADGICNLFHHHVSFSRWLRYLHYCQNRQKSKTVYGFKD